MWKIVADATLLRKSNNVPKKCLFETPKKVKPYFSKLNL